MTPEPSMPASASRRTGLGLLATLVLVAACAPTVKVEVAPINIYAKLEADVRVRLDNEVKSLIQQNPALF